jgi:hypothetical protein
MVRDQHRQKVLKTPYQPIIAGLSGTCMLFQATWETEIGRIMIPGQPKAKKKKVVRPHFNR